MAPAAGASSNDWKIIKPCLSSHSKGRQAGKLQEKKCKSMSRQCSGSFVFPANGCKGVLGLLWEGQGSFECKKLEGSSCILLSCPVSRQVKQELSFNFLMFYLDHFFLRICSKHVHSVLLSQPCTLLHRGRLGRLFRFWCECDSPCLN